MLRRLLMMSIGLAAAGVAPTSVFGERFSSQSEEAAADTIYGGYLIYTFNGGSNDCLLLQHDAAVGERLHLARTGEFGRQGVACSFSVAAYHSVGWPSGAFSPDHYAYFDLYAGTGFRVHFAAGDRLGFTAHRLGDDLDSLEVRILYAPDRSETLLKTALTDTPTGYALPLPRITTDSYVIFRFHAWSSRAGDVAGGILVLDEVALSFREITETTAIEDGLPGPQWTMAAPYPNPGRGHAETVVRLEAPASVRLELVNALGQRIATLVDGFLPAGAHPVAIDLSYQPSGVYFLRAFSGDGVQVQRIVVHH